MAADEELAIRIRAHLDSGVKRALAGITSDIKKSEGEKSKAALKADAEIKASAEKAEKARQALNVRSVSNFRKNELAKKTEAISRSREILDDFRKAEAKKREELARTLRETSLSERRRAQLIQRTERDIARERGRARADARETLGGAGERFAGRLRGAAGVAGGVAAVGMAGINAAQRLASVGGARSQEELFQQSVDFNQRIAALSAQSGLDANAIRARINDVAVSTGRQQAELLETLEVNQGRFGDVSGAMANLDNLARAANGANAAVGALSLATGTAGEVFQLSSDDADAFMNQIIAIGDAGSIEAANLAETFAPFMGTYQRATGQTGLAGAQNSARFAGLMGTSYAGDSQSRTMAEAALRSMNRADVQERLALATGGRARGRGANRSIDGGMRLAGSLGGQVTDPFEAIRQLQGLGLSPGQLQTILGDSNAAEGVGVISTAMNSEQGRAIMSASAADGAALVDRGVASQESNNASGMALARAQAEAFSTFQRNSDSYSRAVIESTRAVGQFTAANPLAADALTTLKEAAIGLATVFGGLKMAGMGGAAAAGGTGLFGAGGALGAGSLAAAGGGAALASAVAVPLALAGAGMTVNAGSLSGRGDVGEGDMFDFWREQFGGPQANSDALLRANAVYTEKTGGGAPIDEANTRATTDNTQVLRDHTQALRENTAATRAATTGPVDTGGETGL